MDHPPADDHVSLSELASEFQSMDTRDRLEALLDFSEQLPELPTRFHADRDAGLHRIHECQSPVFLWVEVNNDRVAIFADVPRSAPTVRGFVALLISALGRSRPAEVLAVKPTLIRDLGLDEALGMLRARGLHAILHRLQRDVAAAESGC